MNMSMSVTEAARELGKILQQDERYKRYMAARLANDNDTELQKEIADFNATKTELNLEMAKDNKDTARITELNNKLNKIYTSVTTSPSMMAFQAAESEMNALVDSINYIVVASANGEDPETCPESDPRAGCGGSCASCSGCG